MRLRHCGYLMAGGRKTVLVMTAVMAAVLACATPAASSVTGTTGRLAVQQTAALDQLNWLLDASARVPVPADELAQHLTAQILAASGGAAGFNKVLTRLGRLTLSQVLLNQPSHVEAVIDGSTGANELNLLTDSSGLIADFGLTPYLPAPKTWEELDTRLRALGPQVSFASMTIGPGGCRLIHGVNAASAGPLSSAFSLYVLGALGQAVASHRASWDQQLAINDQWKSLPPGILQNEPAGTELPLSLYAQYMMSLGDHTAIDHLIHFLGRTAVQAQMFLTGNRAAPRNIPLLTTRELAVLRGVNYPALADSYLAMSPRQRAAELATLDQIPLSQVQRWTQPEMINQIEWFASPADLCRAYAALWRQNARPGLSAIGAALSANDGAISLDRTQYPLVWFAGGSEPGVLTLSFLARAADGQIVVSSLELSNPGSAFNQNAVIGEALALARGGIQLPGPHS
jgi:beta-lactamase class A